MAGDFVATVDEWCLEKGTKRLEAIFKMATQRVVSIAQTGVPHIPVDLGFARASIRASLESMPQIDSASVNKTGQTFAYDPGQVTLAIVGAELGQTIYIGWTAAYVGELERGHSQQAPSGFLRLAAMQWPRVVTEVVAEAKARVG